MADITRPVEVAIIDEFQLLGDTSRGWAWTRALLGLPAREIHLSGSESCLQLVEKLCTSIGDTVDIQRYYRLSPLHVLPYAFQRFPSSSLSSSSYACF